MLQRRINSIIYLHNTDVSFVGSLSDFDSFANKIAIATHAAPASSKSSSTAASATTASTAASSARMHGWWDPRWHEAHSGRRWGHTFT